MFVRNRRLRLATKEIAEAETSTPLIHCKTQASAPALMLAVILVGVGMPFGTLARILLLAGILIGGLMLARIFARIPTLAKALTRTNAS